MKQTQTQEKENNQPCPQQIGEFERYYTIWGTDDFRGIDYPIMAVRGLQNALTYMIRLAPKQRNPFCFLTLFDKFENHWYGEGDDTIAYTKKADNGQIIIEFNK